MMNEKLRSVVMSSENAFQESQFSASSNIRRKVDVLNGRESEDSKCNLRLSLAWDSAFFTSPGVLEPEELLMALNPRNFDHVVNILGSEECLLLSSQTLEPDTNIKTENSNFRKSLAWDNGFFTSEGVLNPFELAIVNNGLKKSESHLLPVMEDEVWRSMESNNTLESEGSSLTRLEMDLFEDIRQSIPKPITSRFELGRPASAEQNGSRTMMKAMPTCKRQITNKHGSKKITRDMPNAPKIKLEHTAESREHYSSSSLKPYNASEQKNNCVSRVKVLNKKHVKLGSKSGIPASEECLGKSKKPCLRDSWHAIHSSTQSLGSPLSHCFASTKKLVYCTTSNGYLRPPPEITIGKSPPNLRRKVNTASSKSLAGSLVSTTPLMKTRGRKVEVESSCPSSPASSSWYGSPWSSVDEWSSESSSTSAAQRCNRSKPSPYSSLRSSRLENQTCEESSVSREVKPSGLRMPSPKLGFFDAEKMLELSAETKGAAAAPAHRTRGTKLQSPGTQLRTGSRKLDHHKNEGTPVSVSATKGNRSPTPVSYNRILQCCNNQSLKAEQIIAQYTELDVHQTSHDGNKENENSFVDHRIECLAKQVNSIDLNRQKQ